MTTSLTICAVEGNISSGKTTLLNNIKNLNDPNITVVFEPVDDWIFKYKQGNHNLLELFYKDLKEKKDETQSSWSFAFQMTILMNRFKLIKKSIKRAKTHEAPHLLVIERSLNTDYNYFAKNLHETKGISDLEWHIYDEWFKWFNKEVKYIFKGIEVKTIYLQTPPSECYNRKMTRDRKEELSVSLEYLQSIHEKHEAGLNKTNVSFTSDVSDLSNPSDVSNASDVSDIYILNGMLSPDEILKKFQEYTNLISTIDTTKIRKPSTLLGIYPNLLTYSIMLATLLILLPISPLTFMLFHMILTVGILLIFQALFF